MSHRDLLTRGALLLALFLLTIPAAAAQTVYLRIADIDGDVIAAGYEGAIDVTELHHLVTGAGAARHESFVFVKERQEHSTVDLWVALDQQTTHAMSFLFATTCSATRRTYYEIALTNARVVAIEPWVRDAGQSRQERVRIDYDEVIFHHTDLNPSSCARNGEESFKLGVTP